MFRTSGTYSAGLIFFHSHVIQLFYRFLALLSNYRKKIYEENQFEHCVTVRRKKRAAGFSLFKIFPNSIRHADWNFDLVEKKSSSVNIIFSLHGENFMAIFTTLSVVIWFSTGTGDFCHTFLYLYYPCGNVRHTEYGNNSHTIDFHTVS